MKLLKRILFVVFVACLGIVLARIQSLPKTAIYTHKDTQPSHILKISAYYATNPSNRNPKPN